jgi:hypothetical protein
VTRSEGSVPKEGLEPSHPKAQEPKSCVSTSSTTPASLIAPFAALTPRGSRLEARLLRRRSQTKQRVCSLLSARRVARSGFDCLARWRSLGDPSCQNFNTKYGAQILTSRRSSLQMEVPLELVNVTGRFHVVLGNRDSAIAFLVDVNDKS